MTAAAQIAALCCLSLAYLTGAEKLSQQHAGPTYYTPTQESHSPPQQLYTAPQPSYIPPQQSFIPPKQSFIPPQQSYGSPQQSISFPEPSYSSPQQSYSPPQPTYSKPQDDYSSSGNNMPMPFGYGYGVSDQYQGIDFGHSTNSDGKLTTGEYRVLLPDGRTQIVKYKVDDYNGYQADVTYEGEVKVQKDSYNKQPSVSYGEPQPTYGQQKSQYQPPSTYSVQESSYIEPKSIKHQDTLYRSHF